MNINFSLRDFWQIGFLIFPMISMWIFPSSLELLLTFKILGFPLYLPNLLYLFYIVNYQKSNRLLYKKYSKYHKRCIGLLIIVFSYIFVITLTGGGDKPIIALMTCLNWLYLTLIYLIYPPSYNQLYQSKWIIVPIFVLLLIEYLLFATGSMTYTSSSTGESLDNLEGGASIIRVSTTIGAATGSALIYTVLGIICISFYDLSIKIKVFLGLLTTITIFFTLSRGSIAVWCAFLLMFVFLNYMKGSTLAKKVAVLTFVVINIFSFDHFGFFDPLRERMEILNYNGTTDSGRNERRERAIKIAEDSYWLGVGAGQVFPDKSVRDIIETRNYVPTHNVYMTILAEHGFLGLFIFMLVLLTMCRLLNYSNPAAWGLVLLFLISFNTEGVITDSEFWPVVLLLYISNIRNYENTICQST